ncbi:MAG: 50S ribosomal protein L21e [Candidatus Micrarchaeota archaeon]
MVKPSKGAFSGRTRKLRGKSITSVTQAVRKFNVGDKVVIAPKAKFEGLPHLRYSARHGVIKEKRGNGYLVEVGDFKMRKSVIVGAVHLKLSQ